MTVRIAFVVYDGLTALDFVGAYDPITRVGTMGFREDIEWEVCGLSPTVTATGGLTFETTVTDEPLDGYDAVVVPGGIGTALPDDGHPVVSWLRTAADCRYKLSVCTGSLLLAAAGLLDGRRATTHPSAYEALAERAAVTERRVVRDGDVITGGGVSSALDVGLYFAELLTDAGTRDHIAEQMDYPHYRDDTGVS
ncbi:DJ-1/PfpI family protein [Natronomonas gomsonensis]|uniref:DJ-1/PfpI family protein n=1 Tax=Natronomonas gomsonensis TaxID=1046043 RepID=UPI001C4CDB42|nr:DJ-1/PfpI family protein [Natronomonas gomsonensis]